MKLGELKTLEDVQAFLEGTQAVVFEAVDSKVVRYRWVEHFFDSLPVCETVEETARIGDQIADEGQWLFTLAG